MQWWSGVDYGADMLGSRVSDWSDLFHIPSWFLGSEANDDFTIDNFRDFTLRIGLHVDYDWSVRKHGHFWYQRHGVEWSHLYLSLWDVLDAGTVRIKERLLHFLYVWATPRYHFILDHKWLVLHMQIHVHCATYSDVPPVPSGTRVPALSVLLATVCRSEGINNIHIEVEFWKKTLAGDC